MKPIDPLQLQRLVDGELAGDEVQRILADAKASPGDWQQIAVGFVENQTWSRAFQQPDSPAETEAHNESEMQSISGLGSPMASKAAATGNKTFKTDSQQRSANYSWMVMAATVLVAATIGYMVNQIQHRNLPSASTLVETSAPVASPSLADKSPRNDRPGTDMPAAHPQMTQADYHLEVPEEQLGDLASAGPVAPVPLFTINNAAQLKRLNERENRPTISAEMLRQLTGSGYQMEQDINYISGRLGDGRSFVVPVRTIRFLPGQ